MAGHSKWANIKHRKARQDARRGTAWSKCSRAIMVAVRNGGADPDMNLTLRYAIEEARSANMPKDTIENAITKASGGVDGVIYESFVYEGYGAGGVANMLEILTDNRNRTAPEIKKIFEKYGGNLGTSGCVAFVFDNKGQIFVTKEAADEDTIMTIALEAGAEDVTDEGEAWQVICEPTDFMVVREAIEQADIAFEAASVTMIPNNTVNCAGRDARRLLHLIEDLDDHDDVQKVHANFDIPDEELAALQES